MTIYTNLRLHEQYKLDIPKITKNFQYLCGPLEYGETSEIPHFHLVICSPLKIIQSRITNLGIKGNNNYSTSKTDDLIKSVSYATKMGPPVTNTLELDMNTVPKWVIKKSDNQSYKRMGVCQTIIHNFPIDTPRDKIFKYVWDSYGKQNSPFDETHIYRIYNAILCKLDDESHYNLMKTKLENLLMKNKYLSL